MTIDDPTRRRVVRAAEAALDKKAVEVVALDVSDHLALTDAFLICSGTNERQVDAIVDAIEEALEEPPVRREGKGRGRWVLQGQIDEKQTEVAYLGTLSSRGTVPAPRAGMWRNQLGSFSGA